MASSRGRARYTALIFINSALGAFLGIWLGLLLTTPSTPFPLGLPFALAGPSFTFGWRLMYFIATVLCILGLRPRPPLPESSRSLVSTHHVVEAHTLVRVMQERAE